MAGPSCPAGLGVGAGIDSAENQECHYIADRRQLSLPTNSCVTALQGPCVHVYRKQGP